MTTPTPPMPKPTIERIPRMTDGSTWYAYAMHGDFKIGACGRTKRRALAEFSEQWERFARS